MSVKKPIDKKKVDVEALIEKGAKVKEDNESKNAKAWTNINFRIPVEMLKQVDNCVEERVGMTRTGWILESIQEKLRGGDVR